MDQFGFFCLSFLLSCFGSCISYRLEPERGGGGLSPGCSWLPLPLLSPNNTPSESESSKLRLSCDLRKLPVDFWNYTLSREQLGSTTEAVLKCNNQLLFESVLHPQQPFFQLTKLESVRIQNCKIRKVPRRVWQSLGPSLQSLTLETQNGDWSSSYGLEIEVGGFDGLPHLQVLDLSWNNIWSLPDSVFCPLGSLQRLNLSHNRLSEEGFPSPAKDAHCSLSIVNLDLSYNALRAVGRDGFGQLKNLGELRLQNNEIEQVEDGALSGLQQLKFLNLSSNRLSTLPPTLFNSNPQLREVYLQNNSITTLSPSLFSSLNQLVLLDLSRNSLSSLSIKESIFSNLLRLIVLRISFNALSYIDPSVFANLMSLQALSLDNNRIENIHPEAFARLTNLHLLDLSRNRLSFIDGRLLGSLFVLRRLYLDHNKIRRIDDSTLVNTTSLRDLGLAGNLLAEVPVALRLGYGPESIETLDLGENRITTVSNESFLGLGQIYGLRMVDNRISELPPGFCNPLIKLHVLNLAQNKINKISASAFTGCQNLRALRLDTNNLEELPTSLTPQLPNLLWLNVSENRIRWADYHQLPPSIEWLDLSYNSLVTLGGVSGAKEVVQFHLRVLDASNNNLTHLDYTTIPPTLETFRVNSNRLRTVAPDTFSRAVRLRRVELMGNQLESLPLSALRIPTVDPEKSVPELFLGGNSFFCDCSMEWLTRVNQLLLLRQYPQIIDLDGILCKSVSSRRQEVIPLPDTQPSDFLCPYRSHCFALCQCCEFEACDCAMTCPGNCSCYHDSAWSANIVECSNLDYTEVPTRIPMDATELYLDGNEIKSLGSHIFIGKKNLRVLYLNGSQVQHIRNKTFNGLKALEVLRLDGNYLKEIVGYEFSDLENLVELHLQNNLLETISSVAFLHLKFLQLLRLDGNRLVDFPVWELGGNGYLRSLTVAANPWTCSCEFLIPFRTWMNSRSSVVMDFGLATCQLFTNTSFESQEEAVVGDGRKTSELLIGSVCSSSSQEEKDISHNYSMNEVETNNHIMGSGGGVGGEKETIHHPRREVEEEDGAMTRVTSKSSDRSTAGTLWTLSFSLSGILVLIVVILLIFRMEVHLWCLRRRAILIGNLNFCRRRSRIRSSEKVSSAQDSSTNIFFSDEGDKLFDAYFLYNPQDEDLVTQKLTSELEHPATTTTSGGLRILLHYRDLCHGNLDRLDSSWNSDMTLSAAETSKRVVIVLSPNLLQVELAQPQSRATLQSVMSRFSGRLLFILLPPLNEMGIGVLYPELRNKNTILDWLDPNFWPKLRILLPTPRAHRTMGSSDASLYNQSLNSSVYHRNILPYQLHVPGGTNTVGRNNSLPPIVPKHQIVLPTSHNWQTMGRPSCPTQLEPTYFSFADNFRFHQQQHQQPPFSFATIQTPQQRHLAESPGKRCGRTLNHPYRPLLRQAPPPPPHLTLSPQSQTHSSTTEDSGNVNCSSCSSDELENEHVYSTLDFPLQSNGNGFTTSPNPAASPERRTMYFV